VAPPAVKTLHLAPVPNEAPAPKVNSATEAVALNSLSGRTGVKLYVPKESLSPGT